MKTRDEAFETLADAIYMALPYEGETYQAAAEHAAGEIVEKAWVDDALIVSRDLLESLVDSDACWFDHHGGCQGHGYLSLQPGEICPQMELRQLLSANGG